MQMADRTRREKSMWYHLPLLVLAFVSAAGLRAIPVIVQAAILLVNACRVRLRSSKMMQTARTQGQGKEDDEDELGTGGTLSMDTFAEQEKTRSLVIGVVALLCYLLGGFWYGKSKGWSYTDACYFVVVTLSTVGYGDQTFSGSKVELFFGGIYVFVGVAFIGVVVGEAVSELQARAEEAAAKMRAERRKASGTTADSKSADLEGALLSGMEATRAEMAGEMRKLKKKLAYTILQIVVIVLVGSTIMCFLENWSFAYAFLWACVTATTVGYGDIVPDTQRAKWFAMLYILVSFGLVAGAIGVLASLPGEARKLQNRAKILTQFGDSLEAEELTALLGSEEIQALRVPGATQQGEEMGVSRAEFILWLLLKQRKLDLKADVVSCVNIFDTLDPDGSGFLDQADIDLFAKQRDGEEGEEAASSAKLPAQDPLPEAAAAAAPGKASQVKAATVQRGSVATAKAATVQRGSVAAAKAATEARSGEEAPAGVSAPEDAAGGPPLKEASPAEDAAGRPPLKEASPAEDPVRLARVVAEEARGSEGPGSSTVEEDPSVYYVVGSSVLLVIASAVAKVGGFLGPQ